MNNLGNIKKGKLLKSIINNTLVVSMMYDLMEKMNVLIIGKD